jgi:uncharacterized lipoprotein YmbA
MTRRMTGIFTKTPTVPPTSWAILLFLTPILIVGCIGRSPDVRHFVLGASDSKVTVERPIEVAVLVGPTRLPAYLQRSQIAKLESDGEVFLDEFNRWLGGFEENFVRAVSLGLARELGSDAVVAAPSKAPFPFEYQVRLHVDDMILEEGGVLRVRIRWALISKSVDAAPGLFVMDERFSSDDGSSAADVVRVHDAALLELARRIADEIGRSAATR